MRLRTDIRCLTRNRLHENFLLTTTREQGNEEHISEDRNFDPRDAFERVLSLYPLNAPAQENLKIIKKKLDDSAI